MSFRSLNNILILSSLKEELKAIENIKDLSASSFPKTLEIIRNEFPNLNDDDSIKILGLLVDEQKLDDNCNVELVITAPPSFKLKASLTENVVTKLIKEADKTITITGYSVSDYINGLIDIIVRKSQSGVLVKMYFNNIDKQDSIDKILRYQGRFLEIYNYCNEDDKMSALHAKVISVDSKKSLVSSANLSYHGMSGNIELGCLISSKETALKIEDLFKQLSSQRVFKKIKQNV